MGDFWTWVQRSGEAIAVLGAVLHIYRKARKEITRLGDFVDQIAKVPELEARLMLHLSDGHGPRNPPPAPTNAREANARAPMGSHPEQ